MKSVMNVVADCEVYQSVLVMKPLNQKIRPPLNDNVPDLSGVMTLFQTIHHFGGWDTAGPHIFKTQLNLPHFRCKPERFIQSGLFRKLRILSADLHRMKKMMTCNLYKSWRWSFRQICRQHPIAITSAGASIE
jgi:hypothetical protein